MIHIFADGKSQATSRPYHHKIAVAVTRRVEKQVDNFTPQDSALANASPLKTRQIGTTGKTPSDGYQESFARMMVNLSVEKPGIQSSPPNEYARAETDAAPKKVRPEPAQHIDVEAMADNVPLGLSAPPDESKTRSAKDDFMDYMNQTDAEKLRQELTGVTKEQYDKMSPDEKLAVDEKVQQLMKKKQELAEAQLKAKIAVAKTMESQSV